MRAGIVASRLRSAKSKDKSGSECECDRAGQQPCREEVRAVKQPAYPCGTYESPKLPIALMRAMPMTNALPVRRRWVALVQKSGAAEKIPSAASEKPPRLTTSRWADDAISMSAAAARSSRRGAQKLGRHPYPLTRSSFQWSLDHAPAVLAETFRSLPESTCQM